MYDYANASEATGAARIDIERKQREIEDMLVKTSSSITDEEYTSFVSTLESWKRYSWSGTFFTIDDEGHDTYGVVNTSEDERVEIRIGDVIYVPNPIPRLAAAALARVQMAHLEKSLITNKKVETLHPTWSKYKGFSLLFDTPNIPMDYGKLDCAFRSDPALRL